MIYSKECDIRAIRYIKWYHMPKWFPDIILPSKEVRITAIFKFVYRQRNTTARQQERAKPTSKTVSQSVWFLFNVRSLVLVYRLQIHIVSLLVVLITKSKKLISVLSVLINCHFWVISNYFSF